MAEKIQINQVEDLLWEVPKAEDMTIDEYIAEIKERLRLKQEEITSRSRNLASRAR